ncbi:MAG: NAD(P)H-dependent glycerol-3-phosphate dehydrogenase [Gemmatimonadales bacterium]
MRIGVIGAGSWGTTLADLLSASGHEVTLWAYEHEVVDSINRERVNALYLPDSPLADGLRASDDLSDVVRDRDLLVAATPSHVLREIATAVAGSLGRGPRPLVVSASKGLEADTLKTMSEVLEETLEGARVAALSGPSFAREVYQRQPTAVAVASRDPDAAALAQRVFTSESFRVYTTDDVVGVQLGGALKNVIAIASGILHGLGLGHNPRAALVTRGLAEMTRLGEALGASPLTFAGLAGIGDLLLTAMGALSRNRSLGEELAKGRTLDEVLAERRTVTEGVRTARAAVALSERTGVELPIASEVEKILFENKAPAQAVKDLMGRDPKPERWG